MDECQRLFLCNLNNLDLFLLFVTNFQKSCTLLLILERSSLTALAEAVQRFCENLDSQSSGVVAFVLVL